jgi:hypothetical protein
MLALALTSSGISILCVLPISSEQNGLLPGDRLDLPHEVVHAARVGPKGITWLEAHSRFR